MEKVTVDVEVEYVTIGDVERKLDISRVTALKWLKDNKFFGAYKEPGKTGQWKIPLDSVEAQKSRMIAELLEEVAHLEALD
jgi:hypothetical protein